MKLALDLGCGTRKVILPDYDVQTLDIRESVNPTFVADWISIPTPNNTFDLIFASYILEHVKRSQVYSVLKEWRRILKVGGKLKLIVPDLEVACIEILSCTTTQLSWDILYGAQSHNNDFHYCGYTHQALSALIEKFGFTVNHVECKDREIHLTATKQEGWVQ